MQITGTSTLSMYSSIKTNILIINTEYLVDNLNYITFPLFLPVMFIDITIIIRISNPSEKVI